VKLNLGCGDALLEGYVNHDLTKHRPEIDVVHDLNVTPWPWYDDLFVEIQAISVLEHLKLTLIESLDQCWRILARGGTLQLKFPIPTSPFAHWDPTHRWYWAPECLDFVDPATRLGAIYHYYTDRKWLIMKRRVGPKERNCWAELTPRGKG
jgi:predicted SAM-dependent methyltransferase